MARRSLSRFKKFVIIAGALIVLEAGYIFYFASTVTTKSAEEVIREAMQRAPGASVERQVNVAIQMYRAQNKGKLPDNLTQLVPTYLGSLPIDPGTHQPFAYRVEGDKFVLGNGGETGVSVAKVGTATGMNGAKIAPDELVIQSFLKALSEPPNSRLAHYDPSSKRDPFRPFDLSERTSLDAARTPLQAVDTNDLSLTAVVEKDNQATALVETPDGVGHSVKKGDKVGLKDGEIVEISPEHILVLEKTVDFTGETKTKTVEIVRKSSKARGKQPSREPRRGGPRG